MSKNKRIAFFVSDGTGITAGSLGGLLAHFPNTEFELIRLPFIDSESKIEDVQKRIANAKMISGIRPIVIMSIGNNTLRNELKAVDAYYVDLFESFINSSKKVKESSTSYPSHFSHVNGVSVSP